MKVRELMSTQLYVTTRDEPVSEVARLMRDNEVGIVPIVDDRGSMRLEGVITDRDLVVRCVARRHDPECSVKDHMTSSEIVVAQADEEMEDIMTRMKHAKIRRLPVLEGERLVGIVAQSDIATKIGPADRVSLERLLDSIPRAGLIPVTGEEMAACLRPSGSLAYQPR